MINQDQISEIKNRTEKLSTYLKISSKKEELNLLEKEMLQSNFWKDSKKASKNIFCI
jgi:hypothetical protein